MSDTAQAKKDELISELADTRREILDAASPLPSDKQDEVFLGIWSAKDLLAHLEGWDFTNMEAVKEVLAGEVPDFYSYYDRDWKSYNARLVAEYKRDNYADLLSSVEDSHHRLIDFLKIIPAEDFDKDRGVRFKRYKVTIARLLQAEIDDEKTHLMQIREFRDRDNPLTGEKP